MTVRFADSFYYLALVNRCDAYHQRANALADSLHGGTITTSWILTEVADALCDRAQRQGVVRLIAALRADPGCLIVPPSQELFERGWALYRERQDKDWSLTDCISFVVMRQHGVTDALTADRHFEQAGFNTLLK
jgi:predicted nucleic acid-binding protein